MRQDGQSKVTAVVLAGGQSRRMGQNKALLELDGQPLIARVVERVMPLCADGIIVANNAGAYSGFGLPVAPDVYPGKGSLGGIFTGLRTARQPYALVVACDMPFLNRELLAYMISLAPQYDLVVPSGHDPSSRTPHLGGAVTGDWKDKPIAKSRDLHPVHAVYSKACLVPIQRQLDANDLRVIGFFDAVRLRIVEPEEVDQFDPDRHTFLNVNTPEDYELARRIARQPQRQVTGE